MKHWLKPLTAGALAVTVFIATVVCCCVGPALAAKAHKASECTHCPAPADSQSHSSNPGSCQHHLTDTDFLAFSQNVFAPVPLVFPAPAFLNNTPPSITAQQLVFPDNSPPFIAAPIPLYLKTHSLRI